MGRLTRVLPGLLIAILLAPCQTASGSQAEEAIVGTRLVAPGTLQAAIADSTPGTVLRLLPGIHPGPVTIPRRLHLIGEPGAVVEGDGRGTVMSLTADGIVVTGLEVRGSGSDLAQDDAVIVLHEVHDVTIERCHIDARAFGIYLRAGGRHRILENDVVGDTSLPAAQRGNGIHLWHTTDNEVLGNRLADVRDAVYLSFAHDNVIADNSGTELRYGIHYMYSERNTLQGNRFSHCIGGIALMNSLDNRIERNHTDSNRDFGILCQQLERSHLRQNQMRGNGRGLYLQNSANNHFSDNRLESNGVGVYLTAGSERNVFSDNQMNRNLVQIYRDHAGVNQWSENGRGNRWSDYAGFDWDHDGVGDTPYRLQTAASAILVRRPIAGWFWQSPLLSFLDWWSTRLSLTRGVDVLDPYPLVGQVGPATSQDERRLATVKR